MKKIEEQFKTPPVEFRGAPFWSWNGKLDKSELLRQIDNLKAMGMGGYFCHSRTGLITEYLGDEWFELINACADKGEQEGMDVWLYDEDRWPSGTAGGMVTENPEFRMHYIRLTITQGASFAFLPETIAAFTVELDGLAFKNKWRIFNAEEAEGCTVLHFTKEVMENDCFYNGNTYVDTMNKEATDYYIKITHQKYTEKCGDRIGKTIKGIFTDEPHRGAVMCGFSVPNENPGFLTPYPKDLFEKFIKAYGVDLTDLLPELFLLVNGEKVSRVKWQYMELIQTLFIDNFFKPINAWCSNNNMKLTGHVLHEDTLTCQAAMIGSVMRAYEYMDSPGVDVLGEHNYQYWIVKQLQSAARQLGKKQLLSELYGCTGWQMDFESHKAIGDWQALFGINFRCQHLSWYTMLGEAKRDYPASIFHQSAWFKEYHFIEDYFSRIHLLSGMGAPDCKLLVLNPVESIWAIIYPNWSLSLGTNDPIAAELEKTYKLVFQTLCGAKIDFDYGDEDYIKRLSKVEIIDGKALLRIGEATYESVLVCGMLTMRSSTLELLTDFAKKGGKLVFADEPPNYIDALNSDTAQALPAKYVSIEQMVQALAIEPAVIITDERGNNIPDIYAQVRKNGEDTIVMLLNINRIQGYNNVHISINAEGFCEQWDARSGEIFLLAEGKLAGANELLWNFTPSGELLLVITPKNNSRQRRETKQLSHSIGAGSSFDYKLHEPNICVLDYVDYKVDNMDWVLHNEILKADRALRDYLKIPHRGGQMIQPWFAGKQKQEVLCDLKIRYSFNIEAMPSALTLVIETPEEFKILINGKASTTLTDGYWVDTCFKLLTIDTTNLKIGKNEIILSTAFRKDINLEAIYLLGDFGVQINGASSTLNKLPQKLTLGSVVTQGLPFYGAGISYYVDLPGVGSGQSLEISTEAFEAACIKITNGSAEKIIFAQPYSADITEMAGSTIELQYILTRRNTFGPLHMPNKKVHWYGPGSFVTEGDDFKDEYQLLPQGMTKEVKINILK